MLELKNITKVYKLGSEKDKNYQVVEALKGVSVSFRKQEFVSILGPSGCGKTTMLNIIGGLDQYTDGDLIINRISTKEYKDRDWDNYRNHKIGFVFQSYNLIPHQTILENVELALTLSGVNKAERKKRAKEALEKVGLGDKIYTKPTQLSGGQMQRVAIARALVNNPDIILADEPTGALDTQTSVQIMNILKEISKDKLIIMVTHNPDLANEYSTRIIKLVDGLITSDSNPYEINDEVIEDTNKKLNKSMSLGTAISLSGKNLLTKKTRTALVSFAGSIGIIGISLILSLSSGFQSYIDRVQEDTLSTYPLTVSNSNLDYSGVMELFMEKSEDYVVRDEDGTVVPSNLMCEIVNRVLKTSNSNNLNGLKKYIEENDDLFGDYTMQYTYNIELDVYDDSEEKLNPSTVFTDLIAKVITKYNEKNDQNSDHTSLITSLMALEQPTFTEMLDNIELLKSQYDLVGESYGSRWPTRYDECVLVINDDYTLDDYSLYSLGLIEEPTLDEIAQEIVDSNGEYKPTTSPISYEEILNKEYKILLPTDYFEKQNDGTYIDYSAEKESETFNNQRKQYISKKLTEENTGINLKITGILKPKKNVAATSITSPIGYLKDLTDKYIELNNNSEIMQEQIANPTIDVITKKEFPAELTASEKRNKVIEAINGMDEATVNSFIIACQLNGYIDINESIDVKKQMLGQMFSSEAYVSDENISMVYKELYTSSSYQDNMTAFNNIDKDSPDSISFYVESFEAKDELKKKIDDYNKQVEKEEDKISYTDYVGIMMSSVSTIIDAISYVLIAFVSVSLVVSSIMIGIITYISVLERTKEIGVLRSIGASKKDIKNVFTVEAIIIGLVSGLLGVGVTCLLNIPISLLIESLAGISSVAVLPLGGAIILVLLSCFLTFIAGLIPANIASKKDPVIALRTE